MIYSSLSKQYQALNDLGITIFKHRDTFAVFNSNKLFLMPLCLVVLPYSLLALNKVSQKILTGMLGVLAIPMESICQVWINHNNYKDFKSAVRELAPYSMLMLGEIFNSDEITELKQIFQSQTDRVIQTFDPITLEENPEHKAKAFSDLLLLKNALKSHNALNKNI